MLGFVFGAAAGFMAGYMYGSERAREQARQRLSTAPEPLRRAGQTVASALATAPVPGGVKQAATRATSSLQTGAERAEQMLGGGPEIARPSAAEVAGRPTEPLPRIEPESPPA